MIRAIIIDDEPGCVSNLRYYLSKYCPEINIIAEGYSIAELQNITRHQSFDIAFLDVELVNNNIFSFFKNPGSYKFEIIFVTAYEQYAVKAFKVRALDYVLKPLLKADIIDCYRKILQHFSAKDATIPAPASIDHSKVLLRQGDRVYIIKKEDVHFFKAKGIYTLVTFRYVDKMVTVTMGRPIGDFEREYPADIFYRVHKSYIVNIKQIKDIVKTDIITLKFENSISIPVAKRRTHDFLSFITQHK